MQRSPKNAEVVNDRPCDVIQTLQTVGCLG